VPDEAVRFVGYLHEDALQGVLANADTLAFPSLYEGFGLPILEAMAMGVPVVCSDRASLPEVAGEAAVYFNPLSVEDMAQKIGHIASNPALRDELRQKGFENVKRFSWEKTARETLVIYRQVHRGNGARETGRRSLITSAREERRHNK
jgi:glycosyltransferase involved in cell wall biosynthesis